MDDLDIKFGRKWVSHGRQVGIYPREGETCEAFEDRVIQAESDHLGSPMTVAELGEAMTKEHRRPDSTVIFPPPWE